MLLTPARYAMLNPLSVMRPATDSGLGSKFWSSSTYEAPASSRIRLVTGDDHVAWYTRLGIVRYTDPSEVEGLPASAGPIRKWQWQAMLYE